MIDYPVALKLPFTDWKKYLIGLVLSIVPVIHFFAIGYLMEVSRLAIRRKYKLPEWQDFGKLFIDGLLASLIILIYFLPALIVLLIGLGSFIFEDFSPLMMNGVIDPNLVFAELGVLFFVFAFLLLVAFYLYPAAVIRFSHSNKFAYAFHFTRISEIAFSKKYSGPWLLSSILWLVIINLFSFIPKIGDSLGMFTAGIIFYAILGTAYGEARQHL